MNNEYQPRKDSIEIIRQCTEKLSYDIDNIIQTQKTEGYCKEELFLAQDNPDNLNNRSYGRWTVYLQDEQGSVYKICAQSGVDGITYSIINGNVKRLRQSPLSIIKNKATMMVDSQPGLLLEPDYPVGSPYLDQDALTIQMVNDEILAAKPMSETEVNNYRKYLENQTIKLFNKSKISFIDRLLGGPDKHKWQ